MYKSLHTVSFLLLLVVAFSNAFAPSTTPQKTLTSLTELGVSKAYLNSLTPAEQRQPVEKQANYLDSLKTENSRFNNEHSQGGGRTGLVGGVVRGVGKVASKLNVFRSFSFMARLFRKKN